MLNGSPPIKYTWNSLKRPRTRAPQKAVDSEGIAEVARAMLAAAKAGDTAAARLVLSYAVGPPLPAADPDRLDANELEALRSRPNLLDRIALDPLTPEPMSVFREEGD